MSGQVFIITPRIEYRARLLKSLPRVLKALREVKILGKGRTGITVSVPNGYNIKTSLPVETRHLCFVEKAESFSLAEAKP